MLKKIEIKNFLTIEHIVLDIDERLTAIIGESGAGKSLILKAVESVFLQKTPTDIIGKFDTKSFIKLFFDLNNRQKGMLSNFGVDEDEIVIEKVILPKKTKSYINHEPVSVKLLFELKGILLNIISQNYRFEAFRIHNILHMLDRLVDKDVIRGFEDAYAKFEEIRKEKEKIEGKINDIDSKHPEILLESIETVNPKKGEYDDLLNRSKKIKSVSFVKREVQSIVDELYENDNSIEYKIGKFIQSSQKMEDLGFNVSHIKTVFDSMVDNIANIRGDLYDMLNSSCEDEDIDLIESRLFELEQLQRKFNKKLNDIIYEKEELYGLLKEKEKLEYTLYEIKQKKEEIEKKLKNGAEKLTYERKKASYQMKSKIKAFLNKLMLEKGFVEFEFLKKDIGKNGQDSVNILFSANPDINPDRIEKVASGGERSRFILAAECAGSAVENSNDTIILDEIEAGMSGQTLEKTADVIKELSFVNQIILVTHNEFLSDISNRVFKITKIFDGTDTKSLAEAVT